MKKILVFAGLALATACGLYVSGVYPAKTGPDAQGAIGQREIYRASQEKDVDVSPGTAPVAKAADALKDATGRDALKQLLADVNALKQELMAVQLRANMTGADGLKQQMAIQNELKQTMAAVDALKSGVQALQIKANMTGADGLQQQMAIQTALMQSMAQMDALKSGVQALQIRSNMTGANGLRQDLTSVGALKQE